MENGLRKRRKERIKSDKGIEEMVKKMNGEKGNMGRFEWEL